MSEPSRCAYANSHNIDTMPPPNSSIIPKAIEILSEIAYNHSMTLDQEFYDSIKMGIRALLFCQHLLDSIAVEIQYGGQHNASLHK